LARADAIFALGGYSEEYAHCEDYHLWLRFLRARAGTIASVEEVIAMAGASGIAPTAVELANLPDVLLRLRKHGGGISTRRAMEQSRKADLVAHNFFACEMAPGITNSYSQFLRDPTLLTILDDVAGTFDLLLSWEARCCTLCPAATENIRADCAKRMGELVTRAMQLNGSSPITTSMWRTWMGRDPRAMLASLLGS
jgi:hypothetical protein